MNPTSSEKPHILFLLGDDMGWNDFSHNTEAKSPIPSPNVEALAKDGIELQQHYMHNLCTPSRAALLTGRYHVNTGLIFVLTPGTPAGLPSDVPTLPEVLKEKAGYSTAMVGKWHLGHSQHKLTPTGKGFDTFTGIYMWDTDSYLKQMVEVPWENPLMVDWVKEYSNGTFHHYAEPRHATEAIVSEVQLIMDDHVKRMTIDQVYRPLFMYIPFTAAHSPLQPLPHHYAKCSHIPHLWRRQFCGMVVGFDEAVKNITEHAKKVLGENVIVVTTADNGGSPWFGGNNSPLRGSKGTAYEGGHKVPAIINDFTSDQRYIASPHVIGKKAPGLHRLYHGMMHVCDWFPTLLSYAGVSTEEFPVGMDGKDFSKVFREVPFVNPAEHYLKFNNSPREELHYDFQPSEESMFNQGLMAHRIGKYKLIKGIVRDPSYYYESSEDRMNLSNPSFATRLTEKVNRFGDILFGNNKFDLGRITITHKLMQDAISEDQKNGKEETNRLYDLEADPNETTNIYNEPWTKDIIQSIESRLDEINKKRPPTQKAYFQIDLKYDWPKTLVSGDCSMNPKIHRKNCRFAHPWVGDDEDPWALKLINANEYTHNKIRMVAYDAFVFFAILVIVCVVAYRRIVRPSINKIKRL